MKIADKKDQFQDKTILHTCCQSRMIFTFRFTAIISLNVVLMPAEHMSPLNQRPNPMYPWSNALCLHCLFVRFKHRVVRIAYYCMLQCQRVGVFQLDCNRPIGHGKDESIQWEVEGRGRAHLYRPAHLNSPPTPYPLPCSFTFKCDSNNPSTVYIE